MTLAYSVRVEERVPGVAPHGGRLVNRVVTGDQADDLRKRAAEAPVVRLSARQVSDLRMIGAGAFSPLDGFMQRADYEGVVHGCIWRTVLHGRSR